MSLAFLDTMKEAYNIFFFGKTEEQKEITTIVTIAEEMSTITKSHNFKLT